VTSLNPHELAYDEQIDDLTRELDSARLKVAALEVKLAWWQRGRELYGENQNRAVITTHPAVASSNATLTVRGAKPTLAHAIVDVMDSGLPDQTEWTAPEIMAQLREHGWMPGGKYGEHTVRTKLGQLAKPGGPLRRVRHGVYALARLEVA
jgi:hypothetical protein